MVKDKYSMGEHLLLLEQALTAVERYHLMEIKTRTAVYKRDSEIAADIAKKEMDSAISKARKYGGTNA